jgi:hypothetical protein
MSEHLLIDPNKLYKIYNHNDIVNYYHYDFLAKFTSIEIDIFYDILNSLHCKELSNLTTYIFKQISLTRKMLEMKNMNDILQHSFSNESIDSKDKFNTKLKHFIQGDKIISLYIMNQMLKFLYPCN